MFAACSPSDPLSAGADGDGRDVPDAGNGESEDPVNGPSPEPAADDSTSPDPEPSVSPTLEPDDTVKTEPDVIIDDEEPEIIDSLPEVDGPGSAVCSENCSNDLSSVLNCAGEVVQECSDGDACLDGACVEDACAAAVESESSIGCDYWVFKPDADDRAAAASCLAVVVANTWSTPVQLEVSHDGATLMDTSFIYLPRGQGEGLTFEPYDVQTGLSPGDVAILFLAHGADVLYSGCPAEPAIVGQVGVFGTDLGRGFNIRATEPVSAYSIVPFGGGAAATTSASLLLPTSRWANEYLAVSAYPVSQIASGEHAVPWISVLAAEDDTEVTIVPSAPITGERWEQERLFEVVRASEPSIVVPAPGEPLTVTLGSGEYLQVSQPEELTGSSIFSNKPVGVWGGSTCMNVPVDVEACDGAHQQIPPLSALGDEYVGVRYRNRASAEAAGIEEAPPWRLVGVTDGTQLSWEPAAPAGAPATLGLGEVFEFAHAGPFVVKSQDDEHPFYISQYMTGARSISGDEDAMEGDPEWVNMIPSSQFLKRYVFLTDPTYPETNLVVVRRTLSDGSFATVNLSCRGELDGWQTVGEYEYTRVDLVTGQFEDVQGCSNGVQEMTSDGFFGVTVWGWGTAVAMPRSTFVSYAYPAGAGLRKVNRATLPPPVAR